MNASEMRVVIVDDEPVARQRLRRLLGECPGVRIIGECRTGAEAVARIAEGKPDVAFLDVRMPGMDGFGVLRALGLGGLPLIVFVTAFDTHAAAAFDAHALDYVVKPVEAERLRTAVERARRQLAMESTMERHARLLALLREQTDVPLEAARGKNPGHKLERLLVNDGGRRFFVSVSEIDWFEAYGNYVRIHTGGKTHLLRTTMTQVESSLEERQFARIHRSTIVNLSTVREIQPWFSGEYVVILNDGSKLKLSRSYRDRFQAQGML
jgi:two-component system, LytTR family, response regulator